MEKDAEYEGEWNTATDQREGIGTQIWPDKSCYVGHWKNNKA